MQLEQPIIDGFTHSMSTLMLPTTYRALCLAQMETLRRASNYQFKMHSAPDYANRVVNAFSQNEYLIKALPGTLVWGMWMYSPQSLSKVFIQVKDQSTGITFISDYEIAYVISAQLNPTPARTYYRYPHIFAEPRLVSGNGQLTVETYNSSSINVTVQLVLFAAEPIPPADLCADPLQNCSI